jgi:hypothetical protein
MIMTSIRMAALAILSGVMVQTGIQVSGSAQWNPAPQPATNEVDPMAGTTGLVS